MSSSTDRRPLRGGSASSQSRGRVLVVDDDPAVRELLVETLEEGGYTVQAVGDGQTALDLLAQEPADVVLLDLHLPRVSGMNVLAAVPALSTDARFIVMTAVGTVDSAVEAMKLGAWDYIRKPFREDELLLLIRRGMEDLRLRRELRRLRTSGGGEEGYGMVGRAPAMERVYRLIDRVADTRANILITGETGTGKELVARAIHNRSERGGHSFVPVNCSAVPETLLESELFGHMRGSFTGAVQSRKGLVEEAEGGTLFLDEISTLSPDIQVKLLRVVQDRRVQRIGSRSATPVDFRLAVATNVDLTKLVREGRFREDLYFRLNVFPIEVPPLRERRDDIPLLVNHFRLRFAAENDVEPPGVAPETLARMMAYEWPGNVRELENFMERAVIMHAGERAFPFQHQRLRPREPRERMATDAAHEDWTLERLEREYILATLDRVRWQQSRAARILGVSRRTIYRKLERYREEGLLPDTESQN